MFPDRIGSITEALRQRFSVLVDALVAVISPSFNPIDGSDTRDALERVARELPKHGLPALRLESAYVHLVPERRSDLLQRIEEAIASSTEEAVIDGLGAVWVMAERIRRSRGNSSEERPFADSRRDKPSLALAQGAGTTFSDQYRIRDHEDASLDVRRRHRALGA